MLLKFILIAFFMNEISSQTIIDSKNETLRSKRAVGLNCFESCIGPCIDDEKGPYCHVKNGYQNWEPSNIIDCPSKCECKFPFFKDGKEYTSCTKDSSFIPWCATTSKYSSRKWIYCKDSCASNPCHIKDTCLNLGNTYRCESSSKSVFKRSVKNKGLNCLNSCRTECTGGTSSQPPSCFVVNGYASWDNTHKINCPTKCECKFPFYRNGKEYNSCTKDDSFMPWCATVENYESQSWFFCKDLCASNPCKSGKTCLNLGNSYKCE